MSDNYLSIKEAAAYLGLHWQTIRNYIQEGKLPYFKLGRSYRIERDQLNKLKYSNQQQQEKEYIEVEKRYLLKNRKQIEDNIRNLDAKLINHRHVIDYWFVPHHISNIDENLNYLASKHGYSLRIREVHDIYSKSKRTTLEVKKTVNGNDHTSAIEKEIVVEDYESTKSLLNLMSYKEVLIIDKERFIYALDGAQFVLDSIKGLGEGLEIEIKSKLPINEVEKHIRNLALKIGLKIEDEVEKSLTYLAMRNTKF